VLKELDGARDTDTVPYCLSEGHPSGEEADHRPGWAFDDEVITR